MAQKPKPLTFDETAALAESVGLPGVTFAQIARGESSLNPGAVGHDPGGTRGLGLWQITTGYNDDIIRKYGGAQKLLNDPLANAKAAKEIYDRQGIGAWYGTKYVTGKNLHYKGGASPPSGSGSTSPAGAAEQVASSAPTLQSGQGGDYTSVLASLLGQGQQQPQASPALTPPAFAAQLAQPQGFHPLQGSGAPQQQAPSADLSLLETLRGSGVGVDQGQVTAAADAPKRPSVVEKVQADRKKPGFVGSGVLELIYNDGGEGYGIKNGKTVNGPAVFNSVWAGHANHVHVAAGPKTVVELGKLAQQMGLHVGENPHFGGVDPVHVPGSYHYKGEAIDVSGSPKKMAAFAQAVADYNKSHSL